MEEKPGLERGQHSVDQQYDPNIEGRLCEYEQAQAVGHHTDNIIHEVTSIVWGANTLLLGFILEVPCESKNQKLVIVASLVGIFMSAYVPWVHHLTKKAQRVAFDVCRQIESGPLLPHRLHTKIHEVYPHWKPGLKAVWVLTGIFIGAWIYVFYHARGCLCSSPTKELPPQQVLALCAGGAPFLLGVFAPGQGRYGQQPRHVPSTFPARLAHWVWRRKQHQTFPRCATKKIGAGPSCRVRVGGPWPDNLRTILGRVAVPYFVPHLDQFRSPVVVNRRCAKSAVLARKIDAIANHRAQSQLSLDGLLISGLEVRVLRGSPLILRKQKQHNQLTLPDSFESGLKLGTSGNKTPATRSTARRCESGIACMYVLSVVSRSEWPRSD